MPGLYDSTLGLSDGTGLWRGRLGLFSGASGFINGSGGAYVDLYFSAGTYSVAGNGYTTLGSIPGFTFTRASLAMGYDATGKLTYGPNNLNIYSEQFDNINWTKSGGGVASAPVITANQALAPDGTLTADLAVFTLNGGTASGDLSAIQQTVSSVGPTVQSLWVKTSDGTSKVFTYVGPAGAASAVTITGTWQRISLADSSAGVSSQRLRLRGSASGEGTATSASIYLWGAQLEAVTYQTTPSTYYPTTTAAYYGPRLVYDPVTLASQGILVEEARTNLLLQSQTFDNASWTKTNSTVTANAVTSPDGTTNADSLIEDTANSQHRVQQSITVANTTAYTYSIYAKANTRLGIYMRIITATTVAGAAFNLQTGVINTTAFGTAAIQNVGGGWYRCSVTGTTDSTSAVVYTNLQDTAGGAGIGSYTGDGTSGLYLYQGQLELGQGASSPIPTTTASVTRAADVPVSTGLAVTSPSTVVVEFTWPLLPATTFPRFVSIHDGTVNNFQEIWGTVGAAVSTVSVGGVGQGDATVGSTVVVGGNKIASRFELNNRRGATNGSLGTADTTDLASTTLTQLSIGVRQNTGNQLNGTISRIRVYNRALSDAELQAITQSLLLQEDGYSILQEDNSYIWLE